MNMGRVFGGLIGLFFVTIIYFYGEPILHSSLYTTAQDANRDLADNFMNGWTKILPVWVAVCLYMIVTGGRTEDQPSEYVGGGF